MPKFFLMGRSLSQQIRSIFRVVMCFVEMFCRMSISGEDSSRACYSWRIRRYTRPYEGFSIEFLMNLLTVSLFHILLKVSDFI